MRPRGMSERPAGRWTLASRSGSGAGGADPGAGDLGQRSALRVAVAPVAVRGEPWAVLPMVKLLLLVTLPLFLLDQVTKQWIVSNYAEPGPHGVHVEPVIPGFFDLVRVHNTGIAFGMANGAAGANWVFGGVAAGAVLLVAWLWRTGAFPTKLSRIAVALLLSGIFGNLFDRIVRGYVVDFLQFDLKFMVWPSFNVADSAICIAAVLLFVSAFQKVPAQEAGQAAGGGTGQPS